MFHSRQANAVLVVAVEGTHLVPVGLVLPVVQVEGSGQLQVDLPPVEQGME